MKNRFDLKKICLICMIVKEKQTVNTSVQQNQLHTSEREIWI